MSIRLAINGEKKKSLKRRGRKRKSCTAVALGKPKVKRKKEATESPKSLENGGGVSLSRRKVQSWKAKNLSSEDLIAIKTDESSSVAEGQLLDGPDSAKDTVEDTVKKEGEADDGDKETVFSKIPLKMRVKIAKKRWKSSKLDSITTTAAAATIVTMIIIIIIMYYYYYYYYCYYYNCCYYYLQVFKLHRDAGDILFSITLQSAGGVSFQSAGPKAQLLLLSLCVAKFFYLLVLLFSLL